MIFKGIGEAMSDLSVATSVRLCGKEYLTGMIFRNGWERLQTVADTIEPATGKVLGKIALADGGTVSLAAVSARAAQKSWAALAPDERAAVFMRALQVGEAYREEIIDWLIRESGSSHAKAAFELKVTLRAIQLAAAMPYQAQGLVLPTEPARMSLARRRPLGVVGVISPFNFPLYLAMRAVAPALAVGNAVILKPDPRTSICGGLVIARLFELAGIPAGVLHVLPGGSEAGETLCSDPHVAMIQFTGSTGAGRMVGQSAGRNLKKVSLELGGKNSIIILDDADLDLAVVNVTWGAFLHQGQICMSTGRVIVHETIAKDFIAKLSDKAASLAVGDPADQTNVIGPLINQRQFDHVAKVVDDSIAAGAVLETGGRGDGLFYKPTVLSGVRPGIPAFDEEIFGPVAVVTTFKDDENAISLANETAYGLSAAVLSKNVGRAMAIGDRLHCGLLHINDQTVNDDVVNPMGGVGASGNGSAVGGPANWEEFTEWQWMTVRSTPPTYPI
jgi:benzaldehyde dehydrogenase (NAD)